jgi:hypothetical protein
VFYDGSVSSSIFFTIPANVRKRERECERESVRERERANEQDPSEIKAEGRGKGSTKQTIFPVLELQPVLSGKSPGKKSGTNSLFLKELSGKNYGNSWNFRKIGKEFPLFEEIFRPEFL